MPPPAKGKTESLGYDVDFDWSKFAAGMQRMGTSWGQQMRKIEKASDKSMKGTGKSISEFMWKMGGAQKAYSGLLRKTQREQAKATDQIIASNDALKSMNRELEKAKKLGGDPKTISALERAIGKTESARAKAVSRRKEAKEAAEEIQEKITFDTEELQDAFKEAGAEVWEPFGAILNKDLPTALEKGGKLIGKGWEKLFAKTGKIGKDLGKAVGEKGGSLLAKSAEHWKVGGVAGVAKAGAAAAGGAALKGIGKLAEGVGGMVNMLSKLGPIISGVAMGIAAVVKLLIDAEAQAKTFNKEMLAVNSVSGFLADNLGDANVAGDDIERTLKAVRDAAYDAFENIRWGISAEDHKATMQALSAEGTNLHRLRQEYIAAGGDIHDAAKMQQFYAGVTHEAVTYSRMFGVSLGELAQAQGEWTTDLGMGIESTDRAFKMLGDTAAQSGVESNKFFAIIRGVTADLNLYNMRIEDTVKYLGALSKVMSPRNAQAFLQASMQAIKGQDWISRTKTGILTKGKDVGILMSDINRSVQGLGDQFADKLGGVSKDYEDAIRKGGEPFQDLLKRMPDDMKGALREAQLQITMKQGLAKGGQVGRGIALGETGAAAQFEAMVAAVKGINGVQGPLLENLGNIGVQAMAQQQGWSEDQLQAAAKAELSFEEQRKVLKEGFKKGDQTIKDKLAKVLGHEIKDASEIDGLHFDQLSDTMDDGMTDAQKQEAAADAKEQKLAKRVGSMTSSLLDKVGAILDWLMNQIYDVMSSIWDWLVRHFGGDKEKRMALINQKAAASHNRALINAVQQAGGDPDKMKGALITSFSSTFDEFLDQSAKAEDALRDEIKKAKDDPKKKAMLEAKLNKVAEKRREAMQKTLLERSPDQQADALKAALPALQAGEGAKDPNVQKLADISKEMERMKTSGEALSGTGKDKMAKLAKQQNAYLKALKPAQLNELMKKGLWTLTPEELEDSFPDMEKAITDAAPDLAEFAKKGASGHTLSVKITDMPDMGMNDPNKMYTDAVGITKPADAQHDESQGEMEEQGGTLEDIYKALRVRGIKLDKPFLSSTFKTVIKEATYESTGDALEDFYMLMSADKNEIQDALKKGLPIKGLGHKLGTGVAGGKDLSDVIKDLAPDMPIKGHAMGTGPMGIPKPAPGEVFVSAKPGEHIGRGGGQVVKIMLDPNARQILRAEMQNVVANDKTMGGRR